MCGLKPLTSPDNLFLWLSHLEYIFPLWYLNVDGKDSVVKEKEDVMFENWSLIPSWDKCRGPMKEWRGRLFSRTRSKGEDEINSGKLGCGKLKVPAWRLLFIFNEGGKVIIQFEVVMAAVLRRVEKIRNGLCRNSETESIRDPNISMYFHQFVWRKPWLQIKILKHTFYLYLLEK